MGKGDFSEQARENPDLAKKRLLEAKPKPYQPVVGSGADGEKSLSPPVKPYPVLDEEAYYGVFGQIAKVIEPHTEADPVAILVQTLVIFGNFIGSKPYFCVEATDHHANLFACLVGQSSRSRKGSSLEHVMRLFSKADPNWRKEHTASGLHSGEGLIWAVRDSIYEHQQNKKTAQVEKVIIDGGVTDKRLLVIEEEFAQPLKLMARPANILSTVLRSAWGHNPLRTLVKNDPASATGAHISVIGHITEEELKKELGQCELFNGFANRFLWPYVKRSKVLPEGGVPDQEILTALTNDLQTSLKNAATISRMQRDPETKELWEKVYPELTAQGIGLSGSVTDRAEAQVLRFSMLYALGDGSANIKVEHLNAALALWGYCADSAQYLFGDRLADLNAQRILEVLKTHPDGMRRTEISEGVFCRNMSKTALDTAFSYLEASGLAVKRLEETSGRTAERWYLLRNKRI